MRLSSILIAYHTHNVTKLYNRETNSFPKIESLNLSKSRIFISHYIKYYLFLIPVLSTVLFDHFFQLYGGMLLLLSHFSHVWLCVTPETAAHQVPPSLAFSRQEHWSGLPFPSPMHESEKWKWSCSVVSYSLQPHGLEPTRLLHPWDFPGKSTGVGCHCLLHTLH